MGNAVGAGDHLPQAAHEDPGEQAQPTGRLLDEAALQRLNRGGVAARTGQGVASGEDGQVQQGVQLGAQLLLNGSPAGILTGEVGDAVQEVIHLLRGHGEQILGQLGVFNRQALLVQVVQISRVGDLTEGGLHGLEQEGFQGFFHAGHAAALKGFA